MFFSINKGRKFCLNCSGQIFNDELLLSTYEPHDIGKWERYVCEKCLKSLLKDCGYELINTQLRKDAKEFMS